jgi:NAD(P)H-hydrate epimerase
MKIIKTTDTDSIKPYLEKLVIPDENSHKGQNGKLLIVGGSSLFHAASIWAAEIASHFVDMVHYCSTDENNEIVHSLKKMFRNGIVVSREHLDDYAKEDNAILIGPGLMRDGVEGETTEKLTRHIIESHPEKPIVLDAGALQMMKAEWLNDLKEMPIVTPHQLEFHRLFGLDLSKLSVEEKARAVTDIARAHRSVILLKAVVDIISDGENTVIVEGGNAGLTKGGTGDILAGLVAALRTKNDAMTSAVLGSYILKRTADGLFSSKGTWYNNSDLIGSIPDTLRNIVEGRI